MSVYNIECKNGCRLNITLELLNAIGCRESGDVPKNMFVCGGDINKFEWFQLYQHVDLIWTLQSIMNVLCYSITSLKFIMFHMQSWLSYGSCMHKYWTSPDWCCWKKQKPGWLDIPTFYSVTNSLVKLASYASQRCCDDIWNWIIMATFHLHCSRWTIKLGNLNA